MGTVHLQRDLLGKATQWYKSYVSPPVKCAFYLQHRPLGDALGSGIKIRRGTCYCRYCAKCRFEVRVSNEPALMKFASGSRGIRC